MSLLFKYLLVTTCLCVLSTGANGEGFWSTITELFNMHKIQPVRSYTLYGDDAHVNVDSKLPEIKPPRDVQIPDAVREEIMANRERLRETQAAQAIGRPPVNPVYTPGPKPLYPSYHRRPALTPDQMYLTPDQRSNN